MAYLRRHRGDVRAAAADYHNVLTKTQLDTGVAVETRAGSPPTTQTLMQQTSPQLQQSPVDSDESGTGLSSDEFWKILTADIDPMCSACDPAPMCAICLTGLHPQSGLCLARTERQRADVAQLRCSHTFHRSCIARCIDIESGSLCCPLCRTVFLTTARRHLMQAAAEAEAAAAAVAASGDRHRQRLQERLEVRRARRAAEGVD
jgi:hypothetical protein